jgi:hypothetical protein
MNYKESSFTASLNLLSSMTFLFPKALKSVFQKGKKLHVKLCRPSKTGLGNSFGFVGHIRDKLGIRGPVHVLVN